MRVCFVARRRGLPAFQKGNNIFAERILWVKEYCHVEEISFTVFVFWCGLTAFSVGLYYWVEGKGRRRVGVWVTVVGFLAALLTVKEMKLVISGIALAHVLGPGILLFTWGLLAYDMYLKKYPKKPTHPGTFGELQNRYTESKFHDLPEEEKITITLPQRGEALIDKQPLGPASFSHLVRGKLKSLPEGHMIWLLTADDRTEHYWPQGFYPVQYDQQTGEWHGRIHAGRSPLRIVALIAPPTSQQLFRYFQKRGDETKFFSPLDKIPAECQNVASVQTRFT
jgi:hypothetical protein